MPKNFLKKISFIIIISFLCSSFTFAQDTDFEFSNYTTISYETDTNYVTVSTRYLREVKNSSYYYPATGEKTFFIPDIPNSTEEEKTIEREFKLEFIYENDNYRLVGLPFYNEVMKKQEFTEAFKKTLGV